MVERSVPLARNAKCPAGVDTSAFRSLDLLLQGIEGWGGEELRQSDVQTVAYLFDGSYLRIGASAVEDVFHRGRWKAADRGQLVDRDVALRAEIQDLFLDRCDHIHGSPSFCL